MACYCRGERTIKELFPQTTEQKLVERPNAMQHIGPDALRVCLTFLGEADLVRVSQSSRQCLNACKMVDHSLWRNRVSTLPADELLTDPEPSRQLAWSRLSFRPRLFFPFCVFAP